MAVYNVLNVGQGDSIMIKPPNGCTFCGETIFIDLGPGKYDVTQNIAEDEMVHIFFTHHDNDHLEGFRFFIGKMKQVREITVPLYQNEITLIARAILNLKGIGKSSDCNEFTRALSELVNNQAIIKTLVEGNKECPKLSFAYEGKGFCDHIECLNPPQIMDSYDWIHEVDESALVQLMDEVFTKEFAREMELYVNANNTRYDNALVDSREFNRFWLYDGENEWRREIRYAKCNYVLNFIMQNREMFKQFNEKSTRNNLKRIYKNYVKCVHDVCIVLKTSFESETMLLTGDASKKVFNRLIQEGRDISASHLKMPHHGSKHNMNKKILNKIKPEVAIISHDNGHFGTAKDSHPNQEILELLQNKKIKILITNDVIKNNVTIMEKYKHKDDFYVSIL
ncbi:MAG: hypothetical protein HDR00_05575 [Lachnospiraceae bacterium]|nr:hypothetical protein [Lachnospiraceae bacterium]